MKKPRPSYRPWLYGRDSSWNVVFAVALILLFVMGTVLLTHYDSVGFYRLIVIRKVYFALATLIVVSLPFLRKSWSRNLALTTFLALILPLFTMTWVSHVAHASLDQNFIPFEGYKMIYLALAVLVPGAYSINAILMCAFFAENMVLWFVLHQPQFQGHVLLERGPANSFLYFLIGIVLLGFRYRDEKIIHELSSRQAKLDAYENMATIFLSLRDLANTPLQTLLVSSELLETKFPETRSITQVIKSAVFRLDKMNQVLTRAESRVFWSDRRLMTVDEILKSLEETERALERSDPDLGRYKHRPSNV